LSLTLTDRARAIEAFTAIIPIYQEAVASGGGLSTHTQRETGRFNYAIVEASSSDFIADVESAARRSLDANVLEYFNKFVKTGGFVVEDLASTQIGIWPDLVVVLGAELIRVGIHPLAQYLAPVDTRGRGKR